MANRLHRAATATVHYGGRAKDEDELETPPESESESDIWLLRPGMWSDGCENRPPVSTAVQGGGRENRDFARWVFLLFPVFVYFFCCRCRFEEGGWRKRKRGVVNCDRVGG